jgi:protein-tyrosine-phosphatase
MKIIFVCTSNVCRSPAAEALARKWSLDHGRDDIIISRSISTDYEPEDSPASEYSVQILRETYQLDISSHRSQLINAEDIIWADVIVGITSSHQRYLVSLFPEGNVDCFFSITTQIKI